MTKLRAWKLAGVIGVLGIATAIAAPASAQTYADLYDFNGPPGGYDSTPAILAQGPNGNLFGTNPNGGAGGYGMVFEITPSGTLKTLFQFDGVSTVATH